MKLLIDIGNTRLKWALLAEGKLGQQHAFVYAQESLFTQMDNAWSGLGTPTSIHVVSVAAAPITDCVMTWAQQRWSLQAEVLHSVEQAAGVINGYTRPELLGVDRWAAMIAAYGLAGTAVCVVDCGTALTCDAIDRNGRHLGGIIVPGQEMMRSTLLGRTAGIRLADQADSPAMWGTDTTACVIAGGIQASVGVIERAVFGLQQALEQPVLTVLTGGDAASIVPWLAVPFRYHEDLVLQGVARIVAEQRG